MIQKIIGRTKKVMRIIERKIEKLFSSISISYKHVICLGLLTLLISYILMLAVDIFNVFNTRSLLEDLYIPLLWNSIFTERGPVEILQWIFLAGFSITSAKIAKNFKEKDKLKESIFWSLFAFGGFIMLLEDAVNIRHFIIGTVFSLEWYVGKKLELLIFGLIALLPIIAIIKYFKYVNQDKVTNILIVLGFIFYGSAVFISGPADLTEINPWIGNSLYDLTVSIGGEEVEEIYVYIDEKMVATQDGKLVWYRFVDFLVEESLELLGATMLFASTLSYKKYLKKEYDYY